MKVSNATKYGLRQVKNIVKILVGRKLLYPCHVATTLGLDDVKIARKLLQTPEEWYNTSVVAEYENIFANWNGSKHASAFMGGRVALGACIKALGLKPGDEAIVPGYTCVVVLNAFEYEGIVVKYCDIELETYGLDAEALKKTITADTKVVLLQHLYGLVCRDYEHIIDICLSKHIPVIEDCAHSTGAEYDGKKVGNYGDLAFYSSEHSKIFTTVLGGLAVTNDEYYAEKIIEYRDNALFPVPDMIKKILLNVLIDYYSYKSHRRWWTADLIRWKYGEHAIISTTQQEMDGIKPDDYGMKMPGAIARLGINQLNKIDSCNEKRRAGAEYWMIWCKENGYSPPKVIEKSIPVFLRFPVCVEKERKQDSLWSKRELGVSAGVWFLSNVHPCAREVMGCPNANIAVSRCINLPTLL